MTSQQSGATQQNSGQTSDSNNGSQNSANGQSPTYGGMTNEEVLSGAMEVFNESIMNGTQQGGVEQGQQGNQSSGALDRTASGTGTSQGSTDASMGQNNGNGTQTGSNGEMGNMSSAGMESTGSGAYGDDPFGNTPGSTGAGTENIGQPGQEDGAGMNGSAQLPGGYETGTGSIPGTGQIPGVGGTGYDLSGRRIIVIGDASGVLTDGERVEQYDRKLEEQMQVFDGIILGRRQENIARGNEDGAGDVAASMPGGNGGFGGDSTFESAPLLTTASASATADPNNNRTGGVLPDAPGDNREGDYQNQSGENSNIPPDISDGSDDDIVARQLREAAIAEKDPELRDKLWDEYRKYKEGVQARR